MPNKLALQSAMEYLMTYGWAILIIAVVLGALFGLGFFNSANLAPKVGPGACQVYRPNGPGTTAFVNLEGTCNNELPQYVAQFNGATSYVSSTSATSFPIGANAVSVFAWILVPTSWVGGEHVVESFGGSNAGLAIGTYPAGANPEIWVSIPGGGLNYYNTGLLMSLGSWHFVGYTTSGNCISAVYLDSKSVGGGGSCGISISLPSSNAADIGVTTIGLYYFGGSIADVQVYNTSLTANEVTALYDEGIGGVPIIPQKLAGWWPLNGNGNDYSGNLNNGVSTNVIFTGSWTSGYTAP